MKRSGPAPPFSRRRGWAGLALVGLAPCLLGWGDHSARTLPAGRAEVGVFSAARHAPRPGLELSLHPVMLFVLPHIEAKATWASWGGAWFFGSRHRLAYPSLFLHAVAREGAGGLLPADSEIPQAVLVESDALLSRSLGAQILTWRLGFAAAPRTPADWPLLDFPFLYPRFAALQALLVPRAGLSLDGRVAGPVHYGFDFLASYLPVGDEEQGTRDAVALEAALLVHYRPSPSHQLSAGARVAHALYPIGWRTHGLPVIDYRYAW